MDPRVALVTAASKGMGAAIARELAARGWKLALLARSEAVEGLASELGALAIRGSVTEAADLDRLVQGALDRFGRIDGVVANTGHPAKGDLLALTDEDWRAGLDLLLLPTVRLARQVAPVMARQGGGAFLNLTSTAALEPNLAFPISSALRAAVAAYTRLFARRYAGQNLRMNSLLPGFVDSYEVSPEILATIPAGRPATVGEVAQTAAFLLSEEAAYLNGVNLPFDGALGRGL
jgi:NAD(P)-dependent dehydrogenase (short-subunit alcohol dehydrogenase family)